MNRITTKAVTSLKSVLEHRWALSGIVLLAVLLALPGVSSGWLLDDCAHHFMVNAHPDLPSLARRPWELFSFIPQDRVWFHHAREAGLIPWFASPNLSATFWRPVSSLLLAFDHRFLGGNPVAAHVHSLFWYALSVALVGVLYRKLIGPGWTASLAALVFAVDEAHALPVSWVANRNALVGLAFGVGSLLAHIRWRRTNRWGPGLLAPALLMVAFLSGEISAGFVAYYLAFALFLDADSLRERLSSLLPSACVLVGWVSLYKVQGFGTTDSALYLDPSADLVGFVLAMLQRVPMLLMGQLTPIGSQVSMVVPSSWLWGLTLVSLGVVSLLLYGGIRITGRDPRAKFFLAAMLLSLLPVTSTLPNDRLLAVVGIGGAGWVALVISTLSKSRQLSLSSFSLPRVTSIFMLIVHVVVAPLQLALLTGTTRWIARYFSVSAVGLRDLSLSGRTLMIVNGPDFFRTSWTSVFLAIEGRPVPRRLRTLSTGNSRVSLERLDSRKVRVTNHGGMLSGGLDQLLRPRHARFAEGDVLTLSDLRIQIERVTPDGRPLAVTYQFVQSLDEARWVAWTSQGYQPVNLPPVGQHLEFPAVSASEEFKLVFRSE